MVILIGLPGSGKSTVGRQLARKLKAGFWDSDLEIEKKLGCSIREYFEREGEVSFRDIEELVLLNLVESREVSFIESPAVLAVGKMTVQSPRQVLSTGGGSVIRAINRQRLRQGGYVVYLHSNPEELVKRLRFDKNRPLLQGADPLLRLKELYAQRDPLYRETAHLVVDTGRPSVAALVNTIVSQLKLLGMLQVPPAP